MWVYQQPQPQRAAATAAQPPKTEPPAPPKSPKTEESPKPAAAAEPHPAARRARHTNGQAVKDCVLLAAAYLLGTFGAGVLQALCDEGEREAVNYFLSCWCGMFTLSGARGAVELFGTEYLTAAAVVTALLLLGLSAFGPAPVFLLMMLYGAGMGLLAAQLFAGITLKTFAAYILIAGLPAAVAAACICVFGSSAVRVCSRLQSFSFSRRADIAPGAGARALVGQYVLTMVLFLPLSGAATGLVVLANQLHLW